jgi:Xaa-Pro aminopeptidase
MMTHTRPGVGEQELTGIFEGCLTRHGAVPSYGSIVTVRGEVLHNHAHGNELRSGDLLLVDAGAEVPSGYGVDVTRTWPANGTFTPEQRDVYATVLAALEAGIAAVRTGARWRDVHFAACRVIAGGLVDLGLLRGSVDSLVSRGAHALFFPHGVGHLLGLDAHDLESFGDRILYGPARTRSSQFGTSFLRIDLDLEDGMVVTVEPGLYFVPGIVRLPEFREQFRDCVDFDAAERWLAMNDGRGFGGVRLEENLVVQADGSENLTASVPLEMEDVAASVGAARAAAPAR